MKFNEKYLMHWQIELKVSDQCIFYSHDFYEEIIFQHINVCFLVNMSILKIFHND